MKKTLEAINELKKEGLVKDCAIGGAGAALKWVEPFFTRDLDIFVIPAQGLKKKGLIDFSEIYKHLKDRGYDKWVGQWIVIDGVPVEFIPKEILSRYNLNEKFKPFIKNN